jgi:predicted GIY-YIG superfamily endonuclease
MWAIYGLAEHGTTVVRYVGSTKNFKRRLIHHRYAAGRRSRHLSAWLRSVNHRPLVVLLGVACSERDALAHEARLIQQCSTRHRLLNRNAPTVAGRRFSFGLPKDLRAQLEAEEQRTGAKPGAIIRIALKAYFANQAAIGPKERKIGRG